MDQTEWKLGQGYGEQTRRRFHVVAYDFGVKNNILRMLPSEVARSRSCLPDVGPRRAGPEADGIFPSNGPGDPEPCDYAITATREAHRLGHPDLRHLPRPPDPGAGQWCQDLQDEVRPPWGQPPGQDLDTRPCRHHQPEPRFCGGPEKPCPPTCGHPRQPVRRQRCRPGARPTSRLLLPGPP